MSIQVGAQKTEQPRVSSQTLSSKEEESIKKRLRTLEDIRDGREITQGVNYESKNPEQVEKEIQYLNRVLETRSVQVATGKKREDIERRLKELETDLQKDMPTWDEYSRLKRRDGMRYVRLVGLIKKWETDPVRKKKVEEWKRLRRQLDPSDPQIANTMLLFPERKER